MLRTAEKGSPRHEAKKLALRTTWVERNGKWSKEDFKVVWANLKNGQAKVHQKSRADGHPVFERDNEEGP